MAADDDAFDSSWREGLQAHRALTVILGSLAAGLASIPIFGLQADKLSVWASIVAFGAATAGAAIFVGGLVGFLFGIPRRLQQQEEVRPETGPEAASEKAAVYGANTNLEQISDWLTKILVGVGLTNLAGIAGLLKKTGVMAAPGLGAFPSSGAFAVIIVIYFFIGGFLLGYLATRLYLGQALTASERALSLEKKLTSLEQRAQADAMALHLVSAQLSGPEADMPPEKRLRAAIRDASRETKAQIFYRAQVLRVTNWKEEATKPLLSRAIPVFRALTESDTRGDFHTNYGELGYALKEQPTPDWKLAEQALSCAITIRDRCGEGGKRAYEFNRAICRIMQDDAFLQNLPSLDEVKRQIVADLKAAHEKTSKWGRNDSTIKKWLALNNIEFRHLSRRAQTRVQPRAARRTRLRLTPLPTKLPTTGSQ
jgi:hypothetical protein